jgi:ribosomal protein L28
MAGLPLQFHYGSIRNVMAKSCPSCNKGTKVAGGYSNRTRATKFTPTGMVRKYPNLQWAKLPQGGRIKICTRCLKANKQLTMKVK